MPPTILLNDSMIGALRLRDVAPEDDLRKPRPSHQRSKYFRVVQQELERKPGRDMVGHLGHKADGFSSLLKYSVGKDTLEMDYRTKKRRLMVSIPKPELYLTNEAKASNPMFYAEACAMYSMGGGVKKEMGHAFVERAIAAFKKNGGKNKGPLHLAIRLFGVHSIQVQGRRRTPQVAPFALLDQLPVRGNDLIDVVPHMSVRISMVRDTWRFRDEAGKFIAADPDNFCEWALSEARKNGTEGWVFKLPDHVFEFAESQKRANAPTKPDGFGTDREYSSLKIREDFVGHYLFIKLEDLMDGDKETVWGYRKHKSLPRMMIYAGDASKHDGIKHMLQMKTASFQFSNPEEKKGLRMIKYDEIKASNSAVQVRCGSSGITHDGFVSAFKLYGISQDPRLEWDMLTETEAMAGANTHWRSTGLTRAEYMRDMRESEPETEIAPLSRKRKGRGKSPARIEEEEEEEDSTMAKRTKTTTTTAWCRQETKGWQDKSNERMEYIRQAMQAAGEPNEEEPSEEAGEKDEVDSNYTLTVALETSSHEDESEPFYTLPWPTETTPDADEDKEEEECQAQEEEVPCTPQEEEEAPLPQVIPPATNGKVIVVFIHESVRLQPAEMETLCTEIKAKGRITIVTDESTPHIDIGVFSRGYKRLENGPGACYFFLQDHPKAETVSHENVLHHLAMMMM